MIFLGNLIPAVQSRHYHELHRLVRERSDRVIVHVHCRYRYLLLVRFIKEFGHKISQIDQNEHIGRQSEQTAKAGPKGWLALEEHVDRVAVDVKCCQHSIHHFHRHGFVAVI